MFVLRRLRDDCPKTQKGCVEKSAILRTSKRRAMRPAKPIGMPWSGLFFVGRNEHMNYALLLMAALLALALTGSGPRPGIP